MDGADLGKSWPLVEHVPLDSYPATASPAIRLNEARAAQFVHEWGRRAEALSAAAVEESLLAQVAAERAIDDAVNNRLESALEHARTAEEHARGDAVALARAREAVARTLLWRGGRMDSRAASKLLREVVASYRDMGSREWAGQALYWLGNAGHLQLGELGEAESLMREALLELPADSPQRPTVLTFLCDVLVITGRWEEAAAALDEAETSPAGDHAYQRAYVAWARARLACQRGNRVETLRAISDVERSLGDWFSVPSGPTFLGDAAAMLERVGDHERAREYLRRAVERDADAEFVRMAAAELPARSGDPEVALRALRAVIHAPWLEVVQQWRMTMLTAWASLRAGRVSDARQFAVQAFAEADAVAGPVVALAGEPRLTHLLAPLAALQHSPQAAAVLSTTRTTLQLLGRTELTRDGELVALPPGLAATLLRLVAVHEAGVPVERVLDLLWPDADAAAGRRVLRSTLSRLNTRAGEVVVREGSRLVLADTWVDVQAFRSVADQALAERQSEIVLPALALWSGEPLPDDSYDEWAIEARDHLVRRRLRLLDLAADLLPDRAETYLEQAIEADPNDTSRYDWLARLLDERGRPVAARRWRDRSRAIGRD